MIAADVVWLVESDPTRPYREGSVQGEAENQQSDFYLSFQLYFLQIN